MSGGGGRGPRSFAARTRASNSTATSLGTAARQALSISAALALLATHDPRAWRFEALHQRSCRAVRPGRRDEPRAEVRGSDALVVVRVDHHGFVARAEQSAEPGPRDYRDRVRRGHAAAPARAF